MRASELTFSRARKLRRELSLPEVMLWDCLRKHGVAGLRFRRQHPIGPYVLDFYCASARLAVEVDGAHHDLPGQISHDTRRDAWLAGQGIRVMRIAATDVLDDDALEGVLVMIAHIASGADIPAVFAVSPSATWPPPPPSAVPLPRKRGRISSDDADASPDKAHMRGDDADPPPRSGGGGPPKAAKGAAVEGATPQQSHGKRES